MLFRLNDIDLFYQIRGKGRQVMVLHGLALNSTIWNEVSELYGDQAEFIMPDLRGHGKSGIGQAEGTLEQFADDLLKLANHLDLNQFTLAGHSMGGYIALAFAEKYPNRLNGLIMVTSNARSDAPEKRESRLIDADQVLRLGSSSVAEAMAPKLTTSDKLQQTSYEIIARTLPEGIANVQRAIAARPNRLDVLKNLSVPILAIAGEEDQLMTPDAAHEMAAACRNGKSVVLPSVGHMPMLEAPFTLGALIVSTLQEGAYD